MSDPIVITRDKVRREWSDFEPKLVAALLAGEGAGVLIAIFGPTLKNIGIDFTPDMARQFMLAVAGLIGWWTHSVGTTVTKKVENNGLVSETHSGNPVTTVTGQVPVQSPASQDQPTVQYHRGQSIIDQLGSGSRIEED